MNLGDIKNKLHLTYEGVRFATIEVIKYANGKDFPNYVFPNFQGYIKKEKSGITYECFLDYFKFKDINDFEATYQFFKDYDFDNCLEITSDFIMDIYYKIEKMHYRYNKKNTIFEYSIDIEKLLGE